MLVPSCTFQAIPVAPGIAIGRVMRSADVAQTVPAAEIIATERVDAELARFHASLDQTREQLTDLKKQMQGRFEGNESEIFDAQLLLVDDPMMVADVEKNISGNLYCAEYAVHVTLEKYFETFAHLNDDYLKERALDLRDVGLRILGNISNTPQNSIDYNEPRIIIASNLTPTQTVALNRDMTLGFAVETGSATSHTAILARSLKLPAVVGVPRELLEKLTVEDKLIIDGFTGKVLVNPSALDEESYRLKRHEALKFYHELVEDNGLPPDTIDGFRVELAANLDSEQNYDQVKQAKGAGIGLFRTEFIFMAPEELPDENTQFEIYKQLLVAAGDQPVTIRTLDVGGDKLNSRISRAVEQNPFLGLRGIRLCLHERRDIFTTQLRALLRAGVHGNLRIMLPMVSSTIELADTKELIRTIQQQLTEEGIPFSTQFKLGIMIETPVAALIAEQFAPNVDFFSIGTNDLIQYTMAVDRSNERVAYLYRPSHPAILKLIKHTVQAAKANNIYVSVCGQIAETIMMTPLLIGLGVNELSMPVSAIPLQRRTIRSLSRYECENLVEKALCCKNAAEVMTLVETMLADKAPALKAFEGNIGIDSKTE